LPNLLPNLFASVVFDLDRNQFNIFMDDFNIQNIDQTNEKYKARNKDTIGLIHNAISKRKQLADKVDINPGPR